MSEKQRLGVLGECSFRLSFVKISDFLVDGS